MTHQRLDLDFLFPSLSQGVFSDSGSLSAHKVINLIQAFVRAPTAFTSLLIRISANVTSLRGLLLNRNLLASLWTEFIFSAESEILIYLLSHITSGSSVKTRGAMCLARKNTVWSTDSTR